MGDLWTEPPILDIVLAYFREKRIFSFDELADPVKKVAIPQHSPQSKLTKFYNYGQKYQNGLHKQIIANSKAHTLAIKLVL